MGRIRRHTRRILLGFIGWAVLLIGVVLIPFPGPGWVIVFIGFSILASEFDWAKETHGLVHEKYTVWRRWFESQQLYIQLLFGALTFATAAIIVWLVDGYGLINSWFQLHQDWLVSPFFK